MQFPGTEMHMLTFAFICIELVMLLYLIIFKLARPDLKTTTLDIYLLFLLIFYNLASGLLPDQSLPGSYILQTCIAYGSGFLTPSYFPRYVWKGFNLFQMKFHAQKGVYIFLFIPYVLFVIILSLTRTLEIAEYILIIPALYGFGVISTVLYAIHQKYKDGNNPKEALEEQIVLVCCLAPWVCLPFITIFDLSQIAEVVSTNSGFLLLLALHLKQNILQLRHEYERLVVSENRLKTWNTELQAEIEKRTIEMERLSAEQRILSNCSKYPLTNREKEITFLLYNGETYKQIAAQLFIAERTVAKHIQNIFAKVEVANRNELCRKLGV